MTPLERAFCQKCIVWTFWWFSGWISAELALIWLKRHLQHSSLSLLPLASYFYDFLARACTEIKILRQQSDLHRTCTSLGFSIFECFFAFPFSPFLLFLLQWLAFCWAYLQLKTLPRKRHWDGQNLIWPWSSHV